MHVSAPALTVVFPWRLRRYIVRTVFEDSPDGRASRHVVWATSHEGALRRAERRHPDTIALSAIRYRP